MARGVPALTITTVGRAGVARTTGERPAARSRRGWRARPRRAGARRVAGRGPRAGAGDDSYLYLDERIVRGWAVQLVLIASLLPFLVGVVDLFARCGGDVPLARRCAACAAGSGSGPRRGRCSSRRASGCSRTARRGRSPPEAPGADEWPVPGLAVLAVLARARLARRPRAAAAPPAGDRRGDARGLHGRAARARARRADVVAVNPYALVYLLPALYAWLWLPQAATRAERARRAARGWAGRPAAARFVASRSARARRGGALVHAALFARGYAAIAPRWASPGWRSPASWPRWPPVATRRIRMGASGRPRGRSAGSTAGRRKRTRAAGGACGARRARGRLELWRTNCPAIRIVG